MTTEEKRFRLAAERLGGLRDKINEERLYRPLARIGERLRRAGGILQLEDTGDSLGLWRHPTVGHSLKMGVESQLGPGFRMSHPSGAIILAPPEARDGRD